MNDNHYPNQILATPWQAPATMERSWGWHANDHAWKSAHDLLANLLLCTSRGGNYLLNIGPKPDGTFPAPAVSRLQEIGGWMTANGDSVYGTSPVFTMTAPTGVTLTQRKNADGTTTLYAALLSPPPGNSLTLPIPSDSITACCILDTSLPLTYAASGGGATITIPDSQDMIPVVKITLKSPIAAAPSL
jgi:alpha-L-fucosidase